MAGQNNANITTLRLVDPLKHQVQAAVHDWVFEESRSGKTLSMTPETVTVMEKNKLNQLQSVLR